LALLHWQCFEYFAALIFLLLSINAEPASPMAHRLLFVHPLSSRAVQLLGWGAPKIIVLITFVFAG
jgi:hypothetical protein